MSEPKPTYQVEPDANLEDDLSALSTRELVNKLIEAETTEERIKAEINEYFTSVDYMNLLLAKGHAADMIRTIKSELTNRAIDVYGNTKNNKPFPGIGIRMSSKRSFEYDLPIARAWAERNLPEAIVLDQGLFEAHALAVSKTQPIKFVVINEYKIPKVTFADDLAALYKGDNNDGQQTERTASD